MGGSRGPIELAVLELGRPCRTHGTAVDPRRRHAHEDAAVETLVARLERAVARLGIEPRHAMKVVAVGTRRSRFSDMVDGTSARDDREAGEFERRACAVGRAPGCASYRARRGLACTMGGGSFEVPTVPTCLACGTCCFSQLETYVGVTGDDHARLGDRADALVRFDGNRAYMRMIDGHCAALRIDKSSRQFFCSAYETRPQICRDLARSSGACQGEIASKHERPLRALALAR